MTPAEQRTAALQRANDVRTANAETMRSIRSQPYLSALRAVADMIEANRPPAAAMPIWRVLRAVPKVGDVRVRRWIASAGIWSGDRRLDQLTDRQREHLVKQLRAIADLRTR